MWQGDEIPNSTVEDKLLKERLRIVEAWALGLPRE